MPACASGRPLLVSGRPFLVESELRLAAPARRDDWTATPTGLCVEGVHPALASRLAAEWTRAGQLEHASIAAFARFVFELLALGAPADLVADATRAMAQEIEHARLCFALASSYATFPVGPSALDVSGALDAVTLRSAVRSAVTEGCVGETLAAVEAGEASEHAVTPGIKAALFRIAEDEGSHAALAWRFVRWALEQGDPTLPSLVEETFARMADQYRDGSLGVDEEITIDAPDAELLESGVLPNCLRHVLRSNAFAEVIEPCVRRLLRCGPPERSFTVVATPRRPLESS